MHSPTTLIDHRNHFICIPGSLRRSNYRMCTDKRRPPAGPRYQTTKLESPSFRILVWASTDPSKIPEGPRSPNRFSNLATSYLHLDSKSPKISPPICVNKIKFRVRSTTDCSNNHKPMSVGWLYGSDLLKIKLKNLFLLIGWIQCHIVQSDFPKFPEKGTLTK